LKYLSVCSGIEAATVAWHDLGWKPVGFSEIEKFPSQVLAHHYPDVTNFGDMTKYKDWKINEPVDLLVGGTPCQSFSVAGLRKGMDDPRGNLALVYCGMLDHFRPKWFVWENVPGVLSSSGGFSYRVLDAQYFGVAQRRRRVFVVGHLGDWRRAAAVLFERTSLCRDIAPSASQGKEPSAYFESSLAQYREGDIGGTLKASDGVLGGGSETFLTQKVYETHPADSRVREMGETCQTVTSRWGTGGGNVPIAVGVDTYNGTIQGDAVATMTADMAGPTHSGPKIMQDFRVRRLTPVECERLQGFPDKYTNIKEKCPDGPRYKALGNSMAVPVMQWIGDGIDLIDKL
jgi:DNA (cytosine-5)-methyltransferase 1